VLTFVLCKLIDFQAHRDAFIQNHSELTNGLINFSVEKQQHTCIGVYFIFSNGFAFFTCNVTSCATTIQTFGLF